MSDPRAPRTRGIQFSTSAPDALGKAIQASAYAQRAKAISGADGGHTHDGDGGDHEHEHVTSRLMDHDGRIANLENQGRDGDWDGDGK